MRRDAIRTEDEYEAALQEIESLWDATPESEAGRRLDRLIERVVDYEDLHFQAPASPPAEMLLAHMEMTGQGLKDLSRIVGSLTVAIDILAGRRLVGSRLAARIDRHWDLPAECLTGEAGLS